MPRPLHRLPIELLSITRPCTSVATTTLLKHPPYRLNRNNFRSFTCSTSRLSSAVPIPTNEGVEQKKQYYVTTPIYYVSADPHIGHLHSTLLADVYSRYNTLRHSTAQPTLLSTGTDEHGLKIQRVAESKGITPLELCDQVSGVFRELANTAGIQEHVFIRTTERTHRIAVEHLWRELLKRGWIYKSSYEGWYAVSDEAYYSSNQVHDVIDPSSGETIKVSIESGSKVEWMQEDNYKFKLSAFRKPLLEWLSSEPNPLQPPSRTQSLLSSLSQPDSPDLQDLSISRPSSRLTWGIPVPDDPDHTIYVWIDALVNYMTVAGYPWIEEGGGTGVWPPDLMVIGKDIIRFHALYLPAILLALDLPLPRHLLAHGHWTLDKFKMSKSRGNVASPFTSIQTWSLDTIRTYLMYKGGNSSIDADWSEEGIEVFYRKNLKGQLGNLLSRIGNERILQRSGKGVWEVPEGVEGVDREVREALEGIRDQYESSMSLFQVHKALSTLFDLLSYTNQHFQLLSPWSPSSTPESIHRSLFYAIETLRITGILLGPIMPDKARELLDSLGVEEDKRGWEFAQFGKGGEWELKVGGKKSQLFPPVGNVQKE